jgi:hypothetical protein
LFGKDIKKVDTVHHLMRWMLQCYAVGEPSLMGKDIKKVDT